MNVDVSHKSDIQLAERLVNGEEAGFNEFFTEYFPRLFRFALRRLDGDEAAVEDIVQTSLMNAMRAIASYRGDAALFTWLCQICRNEINQHFRRLSRMPPVVPEDDESIRSVLEAMESDGQDDPDARYSATVMARIIQEVLDHLPGNYGSALEMKYVEGRSVAEIATALALTELAAQSLLARARTAFRKAVGDMSPQLVNLMGGAT